MKPYDENRTLIKLASVAMLLVYIWLAWVIFHKPASARDWSQYDYEYRQQQQQLDRQQQQRQYDEYLRQQTYFNSYQQLREQRCTQDMIAGQNRGNCAVWEYRWQR
jgi:amino acid permease